MFSKLSVTVVVATSEVVRQIYMTTPSVDHPEPKKKLFEPKTLRVLSRKNTIRQCSILAQATATNSCPLERAHRNINNLALHFACLKPIGLQTNVLDPNKQITHWKIKRKQEMR